MKYKYFTTRHRIIFDEVVFKLARGNLCKVHLLKMYLKYFYDRYLLSMSKND